MALIFCARFLPERGLTLIIMIKVNISGLAVGILMVLSLQLANAQGRSVSLQKHSTQVGMASYYSNSFNGQITSTGEVFSNQDLTAASNTLPLNTYVKVTNLRNHKWVVVRINDRMYKHNKRAVDLTRYAAKKLGMVSHGIARVKVEVIPPAFYEFYHIAPDELVAFGEAKDKGESGS